MQEQLMLQTVSAFQMLYLKRCGEAAFFKNYLNVP